MLVRAIGATLDGIEGALVTVEVDAGRGLPAFHIVGQGDRVVSESRDRIRAAFRQSGLEFPAGRVTVNLAPTDLPKSGAGLDLPIAVAIAATRSPDLRERLRHVLLIGELGLDGGLRAVRGALALVAAGRAQGLREAVAPLDNLAEARVCPAVRVHGAQNLAAVLNFVAGTGTLVELSPPAAGPQPPLRETGLDLADVRGQETARRALELAAAGGHNLLLLGPPGSGKTLLAHRLPGLLPDLPFEHALEVTRIHGVAGLLGGRSLVVRPPLRAPHHTISEPGMIGGGRPLRPGEVSLAHRGVLFVDELAEFRRGVLEGLRQPLEEGVARIVRAHGALELPARFQLVGAMNPCPCGFLGDPRRECICDEGLIRRYRSRLSGPLLDRIDLQVSLGPVRWTDGGALPPCGESSAVVRERVLAARRIQSERWRNRPARTNAELPAAALRRSASMSAGAIALLDRCAARLGLSMRAYHRVLRVARTAADLDGAAQVAERHVGEVLAYRLEEPGRG
ncbi:MAG: YifB family Mg chelatase-like AAA ATPase [Myxococcota bacterium]